MPMATVVAPPSAIAQAQVPMENGFHGSNVGTNMSTANAWFAGAPAPAAVNVGVQLAA